MATKSKARGFPLVPRNVILLVTGSGIEKLTPKDIDIAKVGEKAFGLSLLPASWTLPFIVISADFFRLYRESRLTATRLKTWALEISAALISAGVVPTDAIIVRSSGCSEGLLERGKLYSEESEIATAVEALKNCAKQILSDSDMEGSNVPFVIQKRCPIVAACGHLSNERRCYEEMRDWMGEIEMPPGSAATVFQINLRNWRRKISIANEESLALSCPLSHQIRVALQTPATWAYHHRERIHFEWVWDGQRVFLVQADRESSERGISPLNALELQPRAPREVALRCLRKAVPADAKAFPKIGNVFTYSKLGLPTEPIYILDDRKIIARIAKGDFSTDLESDLITLLPASLVIRSDMATTHLGARQLLPRSNELRNLDQAKKWLQTTSVKLLSEYPKLRVAFLLHNFVPALSSAFAYAAPNQRNVMIEGLWGIPEGLYYNSHDKYVVDTGVAELKRVTESQSKKFVVKPKRQFKRFFVCPNSEGDWKTEVLAAPYDWKGALEIPWCQYIAYYSRKIADEVGKPVSIMWFAGVKNGTAEVLAWHHEPVSPGVITNSITSRRKTIFDKSQIIRSSADVEALERSVKSGAKIRRIRIQPTEEALLRSKDTLKKIGGLALELNATVVLEGGILSHAYYQLRKTNAVVEVVHPFSGFDEKHDYNKLVRDGIPSHIESVGEAAKTIELYGDALIKALKDKLVEEAFEVLEATDQQSVLGELADVMEIVEELTRRLGLKSKDLAAERANKRKRRGGFNKGLILLETINAPPQTDDPVARESNPGIQGAFLSSTAGSIGAADKLPPYRIEKSSDRRRTGDGSEIKVSVSFPVLMKSWSARTPSAIVGELTSGKKVSGQIKGRRNGAKQTIEVSISIEGAPPELPLSEQEKDVSD